ncbi:hypothetical protein ACWD4L_35800 [Streptomyces sp. NPDC002596]
MGTERTWAYRVEEPHGSAGWRPLGGHSHRWRGKITTDTPRQGAEYAAALVVTDLVTEWKVNGICEQHVRVIVWAGEEGTDPDDAVFTVEIQPRVDTELPITAGSVSSMDSSPWDPDRWIKRSPGEPPYPLPSSCPRWPGRDRGGRPKNARPKGGPSCSSSTRQPGLAGDGVGALVLSLVVPSGGDRGWRPRNRL